jgi:hypothetical protein
MLDGFYCKQYEKMFLNNMDRRMHFWKSNHDEVPSLLSDPFSLKIKIVNLSSDFGLKGDIELDLGYSFSYQV